MHWLTALEFDLDWGAFMTVTVSVAVAIVCAYIAYRVSISEARREIKEAFDQHIGRFHAEHRAFVRAVRNAADPTEE